MLIVFIGKFDMPYCILSIITTHGMSQRTKEVLIRHIQIIYNFTDFRFVVHFLSEDQSKRDS